MKLSFIIPYYNAEATIARCLDSLLEQDMRTDDYEIIIVDDGSTHSVDIIKEYQKKYSNIRYFWQENARQGTARNYGLREAKGQYVHFCDADDKVEPNTFGRLCEVAEKYGLEMLFFNRSKKPGSSLTDYSSRNFEGTGPVTTGTAYFAAHPNMPLGPWIRITNRAFIENHHLRFPERILLGEDVPFALQSLIHAQRVMHVDVCAYCWIQNQDSITHRYGKMHHAKEYFDNHLFLVQTITGYLDHPDAQDCRAAMGNRCNIHTMSLLHNAALYMPVLDTQRYIKELKMIGRYPFQLPWNMRRGGLKMKGLHWLINKYPLWLSFVYCLHLLPKQVRYKLK